MLSSDNCLYTDCIFYGEPCVDWIYCDYCKRNIKSKNPIDDCYNNAVYDKYKYFDMRQ